MSGKVALATPDRRLCRNVIFKMKSWLSECSVNTNLTFLKKTMTNKDHRIHKNTAYISINMLYFYVLYNRGHCFIIRTLDSHFSWAMTSK